MTTDQKKALGLAGVGLAGLLIYRHMNKATAPAPVTNSSATGSIAPFDPQPVTTLQPGESVYDPNSQALLSTPTPIDNTGGTPGLGTQATAPSAPSYSVYVSYPTNVTNIKNAPKPTKRPVAKKPKKKAA